MLTVPQALFLWKQSAGKGRLREIFSSANLSAWTSLLIQVYYESTHADSTWAPYFAAMPPVFDQPIFWVRSHGPLPHAPSPAPRHAP